MMYFRSEAVCELCRLKPKTTWYYEDKDWVIFDCETCGIPMIVYRHHGELPSVNKVWEILYEIPFPCVGLKVRTEQRKIKDHWHIHLER